MRSAERTLLASLGFNDQDKGPEHDRICLAVASSPRMFLDAGVPELALSRAVIEPEITVTLEDPISKGTGQYKSTIGFVDVSITCRVASKWIQMFQGYEDWYDRPTTGNGDWRTTECTRYERHVRDRFRSLVDKSFTLAQQEEIVRETSKRVVDTYRDQLQGPEFFVPSWSTFHVHVEVKTKMPGIGDLLRQLNLYREYRKGIWVVATIDRNAEHYAGILRTQNIGLVLL